MAARQFSGSGAIYLAGGVASAAYFVLYLIGVAVCLVRKHVSWLLLLPTIYVPLTIAPLFANMRYSITIQPFLFAFVAVALLSLYDRLFGGLAAARLRWWARGEKSLTEDEAVR